MVRFIIGRAGQGKTRQAYSEIAAALNRSERTALLLIVPEQYTLQAEMELVEYLGGTGLMDVEVTSFRRLAQRCAAEVGGRSRVLLNDLGSQLLLRKVIQASRSQLGFFTRAAGQNGFAEKAALTIRDFKQQGLEAAGLAAAARAMDQAGEYLPARKLADVSLLYAGLERELSGYYIDNDDFINLFIKQIAGSEWLRQAQIWIDGFEGFSVQNMRIILALAAVAPRMSVTATLDPRENAHDGELFWLSRHCLEYMERELAARGIAYQRRPSSPGLLLADGSSSGLAAKAVLRHPALAHVEQELFSYPGQVYTGPPAGIELFSAASPAVEVEYAAARIIELVMEEGCRYRDIAVVCGDFRQYAALIQRYFGEYEIPVFMDYKRPVSTHPLAVLLSSALAALDRGFAYEDMALYIKSGLAGLEPGEAEIMENYILAHGIRGRRWSEDFAYGGAEELDGLNRMRRQVIEPLLQLQAGITGKMGTCAGISAALYKYMEGLNVQSKLENLARTLQQQGRTESMYLVYQGWNHLMELLDQMYSVLGSQNTSLRDFRAIMASGLEAVEIGLIPTTVDQVQVGDVGRSLARNVKALILLGVNDGVLPSISKPASLLNDHDFEAMNRLGVPVSHDRQRPQAQERLLLYSLLAKPVERLIISYARADLSGKAMRPSLLVERLRRLFPDLSPQGDLLAPEALALRFVKRPRPFLRYLSSYLRRAAEGENIDPLWPLLAAAARGRQPGWRSEGVAGALDCIDQAVHAGMESGHLPSQQAEQLYGDLQNTSISRLEKQAACPFAYFAEYGLQAQAREVFSLENTDLGSILHQGLAALVGDLRSRQLDWHELPVGELERAINELHARIVNGNYPELMGNHARSRILSERLLRLSQRTAATVAWQIAQGEFRPWQEELRFGSGARLDGLPVHTASGRMAALRGSIDRVDWCRMDGENESEYVRIIDYKTSARRLEYGLLYTGISLQLPAYMLALKAARPQLKPAGLFYLALNDAMARSSGRDTGPEERMRSILKMQGLVLADADVIRAMDRNISGWSKVLSARINTRDGQPASLDSHLDAVQFEDMLAHTGRLLAALFEASLNGEVRAEPYRYGNRCACDYCPYPAICRFESGTGGSAFRRVPRLDKAGYFELIKTLR